MQKSIFLEVLGLSFFTKEAVLLLCSWEELNKHFQNVKYPESISVIFIAIYSVLYQCNILVNYICNLTMSVSEKILLLKNTNFNVRSRSNQFIEPLYFIFCRIRKMYRI